MPKQDSGLGLIDIFTHMKILAAKWVVRILEGDVPWRTLVMHGI
jgi:hypothetical protein